MDPGGRFFFDVNTPYKHREVLGNHTFVYDLEQVYCVWQNRFHPASCRVDLDLDFFEREGKLYRRSREHFSEWAYPQETLVSPAGEGGLWGDPVLRGALVRPARAGLPAVDGLGKKNQVKERAQAGPRGYG